MDGFNKSVRVSVGDRDIDAGELVKGVADHASGATVIFLGTVRDHSPGKDGVTHLEYETYEELVESKIKELVHVAMQRWPLNAVVVEHKVGRVDVGDASVGVAASSAHRADAFEAARFLIDELKREAPIWKKEHWRGGAEWSSGS